MAQGVLTIFLTFLSVYGFTNAQSPLIDLDIDQGQDGVDSDRPAWSSLPSSDIIIDQEPTFLASGSGPDWNSDDEDYGVSGSGSGSGAGALYPDVSEGDYIPTDKMNNATSTTTTTTTTTPRPLSKCEEDRQTRQNQFTRYVPKCLPNGDYEALQCEGFAGTADCWCAGLNGERIPGTEMDKPNFPNCVEGYNLPKCIHQLVKTTRSRLFGRRRPLCTSEGHFKRVQCHGSMCFCVDEITGDTERGTQTHLPKKPICDGDIADTDHRNVTTHPIRPDVKHVGKDQDHLDIDGDVNFPIEETIDLDPIYDNAPRRSSEFDDFDENNGDFDEARSPPHEKFGDEVEEEEEEEEQTEEDSSEEEEELGKDGTRDASHGQKDRVEKASEILTQPGILAGIIGGAVVLLLCLVLLIMFIVYRMRKKDEGSYPLDEPRRGPPNYSYVRAPDREYYA